MIGFKSNRIKENSSNQKSPDQSWARQFKSNLTRPKIKSKRKVKNCSIISTRKFPFFWGGGRGEGGRGVYHAAVRQNN